MFEIRRYTPEHVDEWNQFVAESKNGVFLFDRRYMDYHSDRFCDHSLMFYLDGRLLAVLPAHQSGDTLCSHNGLTYGGLVMSPRLTVVQTMHLFREMNDYLHSQGIRHVSYKAIPWIYHRLSAEEDLYASTMSVMLVSWQGTLPPTSISLQVYDGNGFAAVVLSVPGMLVLL